MSYSRARTSGYPEQVQTERLSLWRWRAEDRAAVVATWADPDVWRALRPSAAGPPDLEFAAERFEHHVRHWDEHGFGYWLAGERASGQIMGWIGAARPTFISELSDAVEIGWALRRPFWGRGLATEGGAAAIEACRAHLPLDEVVALIHPGNSRSVAVAERLGFSAGERTYHALLEEDLRVYRLGLP